jgi:hypothetical protein
MEETHSLETSVNFQPTKRRNIPEDRTPHKHSCENLKSYIPKLLSKLHPYNRENISVSYAVS